MDTTEHDANEGPRDQVEKTTDGTHTAATEGPEGELAPSGGQAVTADLVGPLQLSGTTLECAVLPDATRVITQKSILTALGRSDSSGRRSRNDNRPPFVEAGNLQPYITPELEAKFERIEYQLPDVPGTRLGYDALILPLVCEAYLQARQDGVLTAQQLPAAQAAEVLMRGLARVGIIALVDEATGYQDVRRKDALAAILEAYVESELRPWVKTFSVDFYREIFRLRGVEFDPTSVSRPAYLGHITNDVVYKRLAPMVWAELKKRQLEDGGKGKLHQRLTAEVGLQKLKEHLASVTTLMKVSSSWGEFKVHLNKIHPLYSQNPDQPVLFDEGQAGL